MKNLIFLFVGLFLLTSSNTTLGSNKAGNKAGSGNDPQTESSITIQCTPDLQAIASMWANEYGRLNPGVNIEVVKMSKSPQPADFSKGPDVSFVSGDYLEKLDGDALWKVMVASDVIVPLISSKNPFLSKINRKGVSSDELAAIFNNPENQTWGVLLGNKQAAPVHYYRINNDAVQSQAAGFLKSDPSVMTGINVANTSELISALQQDPYGIAFCRLMDVVDTKNQQLAKQVTLLPIDKNRNGSLDKFETIYGNLTEFSRGVWIGKYPRTLSRTIYAVSPEKPATTTELAFITWVITSGQQLLTPAGNNDLAYSTRNAKRIEMLSGTPAYAEILTTTGFLTTRLNGLSIFSLIIVLLIPVILALMIRDAVIRHKRQKEADMSGSITPVPVFLDENSIKVPGGLYFDKSHTWAFMEKDGVVRIGIDDFLQHITGTLTRIKMKGPGERVKKGDPLFSIIRNGKQLTIHAPISGTIKAQNDMLISDTSIMNASPYTDGWVCQIEPTNWTREIRLLFLGDTYKEWLKTEFSRFKDFIAASIKGNNAEYAQIILQDGGELKDGILADLGPEVWEDFQTSFIDKN